MTTLEERIINGGFIKEDELFDYLKYLGIKEYIASDQQRYFSGVDLKYLSYNSTAKPNKMKLNLQDILDNLETID